MAGTKGAGGKSRQSQGAGSGEGSGIEGPRYLIGIDLGTTNSAIAYVDTSLETDSPSIETLAIPQVTAPSTVQERDLLPSFLYLPAGGEFPEASLDLPWSKGSVPMGLVGEFARDHGAKVPGRLVASAKSWLCHPRADRRGAILPWQAGAEVQRLSPLDASRLYLEHLVQAWNHSMATGDVTNQMQEQEVLLTVPASFDAVARELTVEAAHAAGLNHVTLIEEPQAAFYAWLADQAEQWRDLINVDDVILVCDIGGGTTDFCVIRVTDSGGNLELERIAVGDHVLLGGDNLDLALARTLQLEYEKRGAKLDSWQFLALWHGCRTGKETLLAGEGQGDVSVVIPGRGSSIIGGSIKMILTREAVDSVVLEGFFPKVESNARVQSSAASGFKQLGLPYVTDAAVTRHLASFLSRQSTGDPLRPTKVLFNGGVLTAQDLRTRLLKQLEYWAGGPGSVHELSSSRPTQAVARGAAYYGLARQGRGIRIRGGAARAYYIGVETALPAVPGMEPPVRGLCVVPFGMEEGAEHEVPGGELGLVVGESARFRFFGSTTRKEDTIGDLVEDLDEGLAELSPVETKLELTPDVEGEPRHTAGRILPVTLRSRLTEVGTLELWCVSDESDERFKLEYNVRVQGRETTDDGLVEGD